MSSSAHEASDAWTVAKAKARLSEVIERAQNAPQTITRNGTPSVVIVSVEEWNRKSKRVGSLAQFLLDSPLSARQLDDDRLKDDARPLEL